MKTTGDTLNLLAIINKNFEEYASEVFNPRNAMMVSKNDGMFDSDYGLQRDSLINLTTFCDLGRTSYTPEQVLAIKAAIAER